MTSNLLAISLSVVALSAAPTFAQTTIERIAPEKSVLILGTKNCQATTDHFKATPLWTLWQTDPMQAMRADAVKQMNEGLEKMLQELGVEKDALVPPAGATGLAVYPIIDPELGTPQIAFLMLADYGDAANAQKTDALVQAALARGEKDGDIEFESKDVSGRTVYSIDMSKMQAKHKKDKPADDMDMGAPALPIPMPDPDEMLKGMSKLHYVRDGSSLLLSSSAEALTEAMEIVDGKGRAGAGVAERPEFQAILGKLGDTDVYAVVLTRDVMDIISSVDSMGIFTMIRPLLQEAFGEAKGYGLGLRFDGPAAMVEQSFAVYMPDGKKGLTTLLDSPVQRGALPPFVGPDTINYGTLNFKFGGVVDTARKVAENPLLQAQGVGDQIEMVAPTLDKIAATLGTQVHWATLATRPFTAASRQSVTAIECTKPQELEKIIADGAAQMGMEARDFLGQRIYTMDPEMFMMMPMGDAPMEPISLGIGGGFVLVGPTPAVEAALRATSQAGGATLAANADFQRAVTALSNNGGANGGGGVAWGYSDTITSAEATLAQRKQAMQDMVGQMGEEAGAVVGGGGDAADKDEDAKAAKEAHAHMEAVLAQQMKTWDRIDFKLLAQHIGPVVWQIQATDDGYVGRAYMLSASSHATP